MTDQPSTNHELLDRLTEAIENHLQNEQFGVPELAEAVGLSKSQLNRRLQMITNQSASQFIREYRLKKAHELLQSKAATPTEVSYKVGFGSPSYFSTCFKEFYGYSPGEVESRKRENPIEKTGIPRKSVGLLLAALIIIAASYVSYKELSKVEDPPEVEILDIDRSIAVIPFVNLSNRDEDLYLTDGVMNAIHQHLSRIGDLNLRSTTSTSSYRNSLKNIEEIGHELQVAYILEGSFQKVGEEASLLVTLIFCRTDSVVWTGEYNEAWLDIFSVQNRVATKVAKELKAILNEETVKGLDVIPTTDMEAYDLYLKASDSLKIGGNREQIEQLLLKAIKLDPDFPLPYIRLGRLYRGKSSNLFGKEKANMIRKAKWNLQKAIELDPYNGLAYSALAVVNWQRERDSVAANKNFKIALKLAPNDWATVRGYYYHQYYLGNCEKMRSIIKQMQKIEPDRGKHPASLYNFFQLECEDRYNEMTEIGDQYFDKIVNSGHWVWGEIFDANIYEHKFDQAQKLLDAMAEKGYNQEYIKFNEAILLARKGQPELSSSLIQELAIEESPRHIRIARLYEALGDEEQMYAHLERAILQRESQVAFMSATFYEHQEEPRFLDIVARSWTPIEY